MGSERLGGAIGLGGMVSTVVGGITLNPALMIGGCAATLPVGVATMKREYSFAPMSITLLTSSVLGVLSFYLWGLATSYLHLGACIVAGVIGLCKAYSEIQEYL